MSGDGQTPIGVKKKRFPARLDANPPSQAKASRPSWGNTPNTPQTQNIKTRNTPEVRPPQTPQVLATDGNMHALRQRMVQRLYDSGIRHPEVLEAMKSTPRHIFVDSALTNQAYEDTSLPIGLGQTISKPSIVARMVELMMPTEGKKLGRILDIGTGCGYQAAILSKLAGEVYSLERLKGLHERARDNIRPLRLKNLHLIFGDGMLGFPSGAPYDAIIAAAGGDEIPAAWLEQLSVGGCLVAPIATGAGKQTLIKVHRTEQGWQRYELEGVQFVPLKSGVS